MHECIRTRISIRDHTVNHSRTLEREEGRGKKIKSGPVVWTTIAKFARRNGPHQWRTSVSSDQLMHFQHDSNKFDVATKYNTTKKILEEAGLKNTAITPELTAVCKLVIEEKAARRKIEVELEKKKRECELLLSQLRSSDSSSSECKSLGLQLLLQMEERNSSRKKGGERYTHEEILLAIGMYKRSPKCYRHMQQYFKLPSESTLKRAFANIELKSGINNVIFKALTKAASRMDTKNKYCSIVVDETSIKRRAIFIEGSDSVHGFHDDGNGIVKSDLADHATVFMLQLINCEGRQPLSFHFTKGPMNTYVLETLIIKIIKLVVECGFQVVAMVCDQGSTNRKALKSLAEATPQNDDRTFFRVPEYPQKIHICFDISHLMKTVRNNFVGSFDKWSKRNPTKHRSEYPGNIIHFKGMKAHWRDVVRMYHIDPECHLKEEHIYLTNTSKMNVDLAGQVLSKTTAKKLKAMGTSDPVKYPTAFNSGLVIEELDRLFDSLNGSKINGVDKKIHTSRARVTSSSYHWKYWSEIKKSLEHLKYFRLNDNNEEKKVETPTPEALKNNVIAASELCRYLLEKAELREVNMRLITQDALENLFGLIKNLQGCNHKLTAMHFISAFKTALLTTFSKLKVQGANSENQDLPAIIQIDDLLSTEIIVEEINNIPPTQSSEFEETDNVPRLQLADSDANFEFTMNLLGIEIDDHSASEDNKISEMIENGISKLLASNNCETCKSSLFENNSPGMQQLSTPLKKELITAKKIFNDLYKDKLHENNIFGKITEFLNGLFSMTWHSCATHAKSDVSMHIVKKLVTLLIRQECNKINRKIEIEELEAANAAKIAELSGKGK